MNEENKITIPIGSKITQTKKENILICVPNTRFYIEAEKITENCWNAYLLDPQTKKKDLIKENITTRSFVLFSHTTLKTPFPYQG